MVSKDTTAIYCTMASDCRGALATVENDDVRINKEINELIIFPSFRLLLD